MKRLIGLSLIFAVAVVIASPLWAEDGEFVQREKARLAELGQLAERLEGAMHEQRQAVENAAKAGKPDLADMLERKLHQTREQLEGAVQQINRAKGRVEIAAHLQEMIHELHARKEAGNEEGVSELSEKIAHLRRELEERPQVDRRPEPRPEHPDRPRPEHPDRPIERPDMPRGEMVELRMRKVMEASELIGRSAQLLREAGAGHEAVGQLQNLSMGLRTQVQRWEQAMREQAERDRAAGTLREQLEQKERELMELRRRMEQLQRQREEGARIPEGFIRREGDRPREGEMRRDGEGDRPREGEMRRDGEGDRPREGEVRRDGDRPREGEVRRDGDRPREGEIRRDGEGDREER